MRWDGAYYKQAKTLTLSKARNVSSALLNRNPTFEDSMKELLKFVAAFDLDYGVKFIDARIEAIVDDTISSEYFKPIMMGRICDI